MAVKIVKVSVTFSLGNFLLVQDKISSAKNQAHKREK